VGETKKFWINNLLLEALMIQLILIQKTFATIFNEYETIVTVID